MSLNVRPILSALLRNRTGAILVSMQVAIALAVLVNALYIVMQRVERIGRPTGIDVANIFAVSSSGFTANFQQAASREQDLAYLRSLPGVVAADAINAIPLSGGGSSQMIVTRPGGRSPDTFAYFEVSEQGLATLGVHLIAGRNFRHDEIQPAITLNEASRFVPQVILSRAMAERLFPQQNALGKTIYDGLDHPATIIGIVDPMMGPWPDNEHPGWAFFMPRLPFSFDGSCHYLIRTVPGQSAALMRLAEEHLARSNPGRVINFVRPLSYFRNLSYLGDSTMEMYLLTVTLLLVAVTALGIFALATFNVNTRTKQIGTRRAVGARRRDIVRYFLIENALVTSAGVLTGCALALATGYWLSVAYALPRLNLYYLVGGVLALWALGQLAAWQPARRAAAISPSVATRTV